MSRHRMPLGVILILAVGAAWTTILAAGHGSIVMWPVVTWLWLTVIAAIRPGRRPGSFARRGKEQSS